MHSTIFQIADRAIEQYLDEDTIYAGEAGLHDYCHEMTQENQDKEIDNLVAMFPEGMFTREGRSLIYNGGISGLSRKLVKKIHEKASEIDEQSFMEIIGPAYELEALLKDVLETAYCFYLSPNNYECYDEQSSAFVRYISDLKPGDKLYIGGVIGYHF